MEKEIKKYAFYHICVGSVDQEDVTSHVDKETKRLQDFFGSDVKVFGIPSRNENQHIEVTNF